MRPAFAPPSIDMLQIVIRCSIVRARIASPLYSKTWPVPPPMPIRAIRARMMSLLLTPGASRPSTRTSYVFGLRWSRVWVARTISTSLVPIPNASAPNAPWVAVCESPQTIVMPGWVSPSCGPMTWTMPWPGSPMPWSGIPNSAQFRVSWSTWAAAIGSAIGRLRGWVGIEWSAVATVRSGWRTVEPARAEAAERLRRGDLVDEMEVDGEDRRGALVLVDDVVVPDLLDDRAGSGHGVTARSVLAGAEGQRVAQRHAGCADAGRAASRPRYWRRVHPLRDPDRACGRTAHGRTPRAARQRPIPARLGRGRRSFVLQLALFSSLADGLSTDVIRATTCCRRSSWSGSSSPTSD